MPRLFAIAAVVACCTALPAAAQPATFTYSFDDPNAAFGPSSSSGNTAGVASRSVDGYQTVNAGTGFATISGTNRAVTTRAYRGTLDTNTSTYFRVMFFSTSAGQAVRLNSISFDLSNQGSAAPVTSFALYAGSYTLANNTTTGLAAVPGVGGSIGSSFSTSSFSGLSAESQPGQRLELRLYVFGNGGSDPTANNIFIDNLVVTLTPVPVPEPAMAGLLAAAGLGAVRLARRRLA